MKFLDTYDEAIKKLRKAEAGDGLSSTDVDDMGRGKRKRKVLKHFASSSAKDSDDTDVFADSESDGELTYPDIPSATNIVNQGSYLLIRSLIYYVL